MSRDRRLIPDEDLDKFGNPKIGEGVGFSRPPREPEERKSVAETVIEGAVNFLKDNYFVVGEAGERQDEERARAERKELEAAMAAIARNDYYIGNVSESRELDSSYNQDINADGIPDDMNRDNVEDSSQNLSYSSYDGYVNINQGDGVFGNVRDADTHRLKGMYERIATEYQQYGSDLKVLANPGTDIDTIASSLCKIAQDKKFVQELKERDEEYWQFLQALNEELKNTK